MIAVDTNILVHAHRKDSPFHQEAAACIEELAGSRTPWALPWPCIYEFIVITTHPKIYSPPTPLEKAIDQVDAWLESESVTLLAETSGHWDAFRKMAMASRIAGPVIHDAKVAALCRVHGVKELWSADRDFSRFPDLKVKNPLIG